MIHYRDIRVLGKKLHVQHIQLQSAAKQPYLVFLHEGLGSIAQWKDFPVSLCKATGLNGIVYDRQGYGQSDKMALPRTKEYLEIEAKKYLPTLLHQLNISNPILFGHSDGGSIALVYAALFPVKALITAAAHIYVEPITIKGIEEVVQLYETTNFKEKLARYHGEKTATVFSSWADTWLADWFQDWNLSAYLTAIDIPSLVIQGRNDQFATLQHAKDIAKGIGQKATFHFLEKCGHSPHIQAKVSLLSSAADFIAEQL